MRRSPVARRAKGRCEYCRAPEEVCAYTFHVEHIIPRSRGGADDAANGALSCWSSNSAKSNHLTGVDPETSREEPLFHPRQQRWEEHFALSVDSLHVLGSRPWGEPMANKRN